MSVSSGPTRMTTRAETVALLAFADEAAAHFAKEPRHFTYGTLEPGSLLGIRWGLGEDCVLVVKLDDYAEKVNFQNIVPRAKP